MSPNEDTRMRKGIGTIVNRPTITGGKHYDKIFAYIPSNVAKDSNFPFQIGDKIEVRIEGQAVIITKAET